MDEPTDPTIEAFRELHKACRQLFDVVTESLHLPQLVDWLNRKLTR